MSARGLIHDYKAGVTANSAVRILEDGRLQIPLYLLALRELLGLEPVGGLFRALGPRRHDARAAGRRRTRTRSPPGLYANDVLPHRRLRGRHRRRPARSPTRRVARIRRGDVRHDPRGGSCPSFCPWAGVCRVPR